VRSWWTNRCLKVSTTADGQAVTTDSLDPDWWSQQWIREPVNGGVRLRNRWTNRYLTVGTNPGAPQFLPITSTSAPNGQNQVWSIQ
jgi:hypothetical protein